MKLKNIKAFNRNFDVAVSRLAGKYRIDVLSEGKIIKWINWDGRSPVKLTF